MIGRRAVKMAELRRTFESLKLTNVTTILASGNVVFESNVRDVLPLARTIERTLKGRLGYDVSVVLRTADQLKAVVRSKPFEGVTVTQRTKFLVTLLSERPHRSFRTPYASPERDFEILRVSPTAVFSVVTLAPNKHSSGIMSFLEREFGAGITTRNWNTILKILKA
jgi:uncharacterized protein (DUF1697 family)